MRLRDILVLGTPALIVSDNLDFIIILLYMRSMFRLSDYTYRQAVA